MIEMKKFNIEDLTRYDELMNNYYKILMIMIKKNVQSY